MTRPHTEYAPLTYVWCMSQGSDDHIVDLSKPVSERVAACGSRWLTRYDHRIWRSGEISMRCEGCVAATPGLPGPVCN